MSYSMMCYEYAILASYLHFRIDNGLVVAKVGSLISRAQEPGGGKLLSFKIQDALLNGNKKVGGILVSPDAGDMQTLLYLKVTVTTTPKAMCAHFGFPWTLRPQKELTE